MIQPVRNEWWTAALIALAIGCSTTASPGGVAPEDQPGGDDTPGGGNAPGGDDDTIAGGQSGTDGNGGTACKALPDTALGFDEVTPSGSAAQLRDDFESVLAAHPEITLRWHHELGEATTLAIDVVEWGDPVQRNLDCGGNPQSYLKLPASLHLSTADGLLDLTFEGVFQDHDWSADTDPAPILEGPIGERLRAAFDREDLSLDSFGVSLTRNVDGLAGQIRATDGIEDQAIADALYRLGQFDSTWPDASDVESYQQPDALADACAAAQPTSPGFQAFESNEALLDALAGNWVRCSGEAIGTPTHDGIAIASDGTWTHLAERDGALIEQRGFDHEGTFEVSESWGRYGAARQLGIYRVGGIEYAFSSDRRTLHLELFSSGQPGAQSFDNVYVRTELSIGPPELSRQADEHAGAPACEEGEAFVHRFASVDELQAKLAGSWAICSGAYREGAVAIAFDTDGRYRHLDQNGETIVEGQYDVSSTMQVNMVDDDVPADRLTRVYVMLAPLISGTPVKLLTQGETGSTTLSAMP